MRFEKRRLYDLILTASFLRSILWNAGRTLQNNKKRKHRAYSTALEITEQSRNSTQTIGKQKKVLSEQNFFEKAENWSGGKTGCFEFAARNTNVPRTTSFRKSSRSVPMMPSDGSCVLSSSWIYVTTASWAVSNVPDLRLRETQRNKRTAMERGSTVTGVEGACSFDFSWRSAEGASSTRFSLATGTVGKWHSSGDAAGACCRGERRLPFRLRWGIVGGKKIKGRVRIRVIFLCGMRVRLTTWNLKSSPQIQKENANPKRNEELLLLWVWWIVEPSRYRKASKSVRKWTLSRHQRFRYR